MNLSYHHSKSFIPTSMPDQLRISSNNQHPVPQNKQNEEYFAQDKVVKLGNGSHAKKGRKLKLAENGGIGTPKTVPEHAYVGGVHMNSPTQWRVVDTFGSELKLPDLSRIGIAENQQKEPKSAGKYRRIHSDNSPF